MTNMPGKPMTSDVSTLKSWWFAQY